MRSSARSFSGIGAFLGSAEDVTLSGAGDPEALKAARVSGNFLKILAVPLRLGRSFLPEEDTPRGSPVAMISARLWKRRFGGDPLVIGKTVTLNAIPHTIVGVLPANFSFPFANVDVWVPRPSEWSRLPARYWRTVTLLRGFARLKPRVSLQEAQSEMAVLNAQYLAAHPDFDAVPGITMRVAWLKDRLVENVRPMLLILFGAVGFVLLIACSNVAGLMLARLTSRSREFALRAALAAGRGRLIRQLLTESLILSVAGGLLGFLEAKWISVAIARSTVFTNPTRLGSLSIPGAGEVRLDVVVLAFTVVLSIATGVFFGLFPSLRMSRPDLATVLRESGAAVTIRHLVGQEDSV
jgi:predicted permease